MRQKAPILVEVVGPGKARITIRVSVYPQVGRHWKEQLTGPNRMKWGRIYIDPSKEAAIERRSDAMWEHGPAMVKGLHVNRDECPGAMFIWETQETADVEELCATDNQKFGRELYHALRETLLPLQVVAPREGKNRLGWWEVVFRFLD
jgi:hypothetical protein